MIRSWMFVPGDQDKKLIKADTYGADAIIFDLEDAVAPRHKELARDLVGALLLRQKANIPRYVRINGISSPRWEEDVSMVADHQVNGVLLPKAEWPEQIHTVVSHIKAHKDESQSKSKKVGIEVIPIIETALGLQNVTRIANCSSWVSRFALGALDLALDLGVRQLSDELMAYARSQLVIVSKAARLAAPVDSAFPDLNDSERLIRETVAARKMGFSGKLIIHPRQVSIVNHVFEPSEEEMTEAVRIIEAYETAKESGKGAIQVNGKMVDEPIYEQARKLLQLGRAEVD